MHGLMERGDAMLVWLCGEWKEGSAATLRRVRGEWTEGCCRLIRRHSSAEMEAHMWWLCCLDNCGLLLLIT